MLWRSPMNTALSARARKCSSTKSRIADGVCNQVNILAIAAEAAVQEFERPLVDADGGDGTLPECISDDVLVFEDDSLLDTFEAGESTVRI